MEQLLNRKTLWSDLLPGALAGGRLGGRLGERERERAKEREREREREREHSHGAAALPSSTCARGAAGPDSRARAGGPGARVRLRGLTAGGIRALTQGALELGDLRDWNTSATD